MNFGLYSLLEDPLFYNMQMIPQWKISESPLDYGLALQSMENHVACMKSNTQEELIWLLEHHPVYTAGTSANSKDLLKPDQFPVYTIGRGGQYTYHGPGQRVIYTMLHLAKRQSKDLKCFIHHLESWIINSLAQFDIEGFRREGRVGIWVLDTQGNESKIAAIGVRVSKWITFHGAAINVHPDMTAYNGIIPCGIEKFGVTSMHALGKNITLAALDQVLQEQFYLVF